MLIENIFRTILGLSCCIVILYLIIDLIINVNTFFLFKKQYFTCCTYTKLCNEIMFYTSNDLVKMGIKYYPKVKVNYYRHKEKLGHYCPNNNEIVIYLKNHIGQNNNYEIGQIVDTILHEVRHYQQHKTTKEFIEELNSENYGYSSNIEKDARKYARNNLINCLAYLKQKNIIY